jgi:hypothetical protein
MFRKLLWAISLALSLVVSFSGPLLDTRGLAKTAATPATEVVQCRVLESLDDKRLGVAVIIFHQRDKTDGPRLGRLLTDHSGEVMEIETADHRAHRVTVFRVRSCFGRGVFLLPSDIKLKEREEFVLRKFDRI